MSKICPFTNDTVLYLDCKECDDSAECRKLSILGKTVDTEKEKEKGKEEEYEK